MIDFPGLASAEKQTDAAARLLRGAAEQLEGDVPEGGWAARAAQLRGIAMVVQAAALELAAVGGWNAAASEASEANLLNDEQLTPTSGDESR